VVRRGFGTVMQKGEAEEWQRRDGFEVGNAVGIFDSTQLARGATTASPGAYGYFNEHTQ
jgi:hypothetical protein